MLNNKKEDMRPYDMKKAPMKTPKFMMPLIWSACWAMTKSSGLKIHKVGMDSVKPPFLVFATHQGFSDYYIAPLALKPYRPNYVSDMEGFAAFGKTLYRSIGCIGKRRYVPDVTVIQNISTAFEMGNPVVLYPESRHSNVGTTAILPSNLGRLAKHFARYYNTPLVILSAHGSYLTNPFWDEEHTRRGKMEARLELLYTAKELINMDADDIQKKIEEKLTYDEYDWQKKRNIPFRGKNLAQGLHLPLYQCRNCKSRHTMISKGDYIGCKSCKKIWKLSPYGYLFDREGHKNSIVEWYNWEMGNVKKKLDISPTRRSFKVHIESLPNEYGFINLGEGSLTVDKEGFILVFDIDKNYNYIPKDWKYTSLPDKSSGKSSKKSRITITFPHKTRESLQTEYNYKGRGPAIVLSNLDATYYLYSDDKDFNPTELQFISEYYIYQ
ncbi:MAG: hypothetical protein K6E10_04220 [Eubacterium sp.]|nr:hypothetical protein [Eubacterium sp.]